ncbi:PaaI family thioesterase [Sneathiella aquimaris]|uniref:PaaI family thioesterase n=1 Tax=Sneathiella aquimaris TaxID=2599305 RepID=UPI00146F33DF|nr:PaaI family thioesterase [Sneathiella aquimaris]
METSVPEGFELFNGIVGFVETTGPLYVKYEGGQAYCGLRIQDKHCNIANICHGGMLMTFADMQLGIGSQVANKIGKFLPTVHMSCDFVSPAPNGAWLEGRTTVIKQTRKTIFATCILTADGENVFSGTGIMKIPGDNGQFKDIVLPSRG